MFDLILDLYMSPPKSPQELQARIQAHLQAQADAMVADGTATEAWVEGTDIVATVHGHKVRMRNTFRPIHIEHAEARISGALRALHGEEKGEAMWEAIFDIVNRQRGSSGE